MHCMTWRALFVRPYALAELLPLMQDKLALAVPVSGVYGQGCSISLIAVAAICQAELLPFTKRRRGKTPKIDWQFTK